MSSLKLKARLNKARCPYCHDDLNGELVECESCSASHHSECWGEHGACAACKSVNANKWTPENLERYRNFLENVPNIIEDRLPFPLWLFAMLIQVLIFTVTAVLEIIMTIGEIAVSIAVAVINPCLKVAALGVFLFLLLKTVGIL